MNCVWVNGCFDVLHVGHIQLFKYAKRFGNYLIVGIDTDARVKQAKGKTRPFNTLKDRVMMLESIKQVNKVVTFGTDEQLKEQILKSGAKIIVVGTEYKTKKVIGSELVDKVVFFDRIKKYSTTKILENK
tara:strand:- start:229 stop:618 length:390 start_codon:yes stop_codon:yes gene_type:complete